MYNCNTIGTVAIGALKYYDAEGHVVDWLYEGLKAHVVSQGLHQLVPRPEREII